MPSSQFSEALAALDPTTRSRVTAQLDAWKALVAVTATEDWSQVAANIENETAIPVTIFTALLELWLQTISSGTAPVDAWLIACETQRGDSFLGRQLDESLCPRLLGRATSANSYAKYLSENSPSDSGNQLTYDVCRELLDQNSGKPLNPLKHSEFEKRLRKTSLGGSVIWATFQENHPGQPPFDHRFRPTENACTMLGLPLSSDVMILLEYDRSLYDEAAVDLLERRPDLHRPTVAEAGRHYLFRPGPRQDSPWGHTCPTHPNPAQLPGAPEVVHRRINGKGLRLPFFLTVTPAIP